MDAARALSELTEISSQIECAVLVDGGAVVASTFADDARADRVAAAAHDLLEAADGVGDGGNGEPLVQLEAALEDGSVFVVRDGARLIAAVTGPEPTVGLVFYDLKSCLRSVAAGPEGDGLPRPTVPAVDSNGSIDDGASA